MGGLSGTLTSLTQLHVPECEHLDKVRPEWHNVSADGGTIGFAVTFTFPVSCTTYSTVDLRYFILVLQAMTLL